MSKYSAYGILKRWDQKSVIKVMVSWSNETV